MAWDVRLQDENCKPVIPFDAAIEFGMIPQSGEFKLLHYIDPLGDTIFNRLQMDDFLHDWSRLQPNTGEREQWKIVFDFASKCKSEPHLYLRFIGD